MPRREVNLRCHCVARGCNIFQDGSGITGHPVTAAQLRQHQSTDRSRLLADAYAKMQAEVFQQNEAQVEAQLSKDNIRPLSLTTLSAISKEFRTQKEMQLINLISPIVNKVSQHEQRLRTLAVQTPNSLVCAADFVSWRLCMRRLDLWQKLYT